jgi:hypothetical protein
MINSIVVKRNRMKKLKGIGATGCEGDFWLLFAYDSPNHNAWYDPTPISILYTCAFTRRNGR